MTNESSPVAQTSKNRGTWQFSLRTLFLLVTLFAFLSAMMSIALQARSTAKRHQTREEFKWISLALRIYCDVENRLPAPVYRDPDGKPLYSWRFSIIGFVASYKKNISYSKSWDSPENAHWLTVETPYAPEWQGNITRAFAITGPGTAFGGGLAEEPRSLNELDEDTILVVEVRNSKTH